MSKASGTKTGTPAHDWWGISRITQNKRFDQAARWLFGHSPILRTGWDDLASDESYVVGKIQQFGTIAGRSIGEYSDRLWPTSDWPVYNRDYRDRGYSAPRRYKTAAAKEQEYWEAQESERVKRRLLQSDHEWDAEEKRLENVELLKTRSREVKKIAKHIVARAEAERVHAIAEAQALREAAQREQAERYRARGQHVLREAQREQTYTAGSERVLEAMARKAPLAEVMFPGWHDVEMQLIRFIQQAGAENWAVEIYADGRTWIALSASHFCEDISSHRFRGGLVVPPWNWKQFLAQYREGLAQYFDFKRPRQPDQFLNPHEREVYRLELLRCVREREQQVISQGGMRAKRNLAHALGVDHRIIWTDG